MAFTFIYSFSDLLLPLIFGNTYSTASLYTKLMFLTMLVFPTAILQANLLVAIKLEKFDMIFNLVSLGLYLAFTFIGLYLFNTLEVINLSIFVSFFIFHVLQDILLLRKKITTLSHVLLFYVGSIVCIAVYLLLAKITNVYIAFFLLWILAGTAIITLSPKAGNLVTNLIGKQTK
jgi:O-antigen/teichoic acid export membrane protein